MRGNILWGAKFSDYECFGFVMYVKSFGLDGVSSKAKQLTNYALQGICSACNMNASVEKFRKLLLDIAPECKSVVDAPAEASGSWWIDLALGKRRVSLEFCPGRGFGFFEKKAQFGEGPVEVYAKPELAARRAAQLLKIEKGESSDLTLKDLRELYELSQIDLAEKVGVKQSAISRFEQRSEVKVGTLAAAVKALGGELEIRAHFPDADVALSVK